MSESKKSPSVMLATFLFRLFGIKDGDPHDVDAGLFVRLFTVERLSGRSAVPGKKTVRPPDKPACIKWFNLLIYKRYAPSKLADAIARIRASKVDKNGGEIGGNGVNSVNAAIEQIAEDVRLQIDALPEAKSATAKAELEILQQRHADLLSCIVWIGRKSSVVKINDDSLDLEGFEFETDASE